MSAIVTMQQEAKHSHSRSMSEILKIKQLYENPRGLTVDSESQYFETRIDDVLQQAGSKSGPAWETVLKWCRKHQHDASCAEPYGQDSWLRHQLTGFVPPAERELLNVGYAALCDVMVTAKELRLKPLLDISGQLVAEMYNQNETDYFGDRWD